MYSIGTTTFVSAQSDDNERKNKTHLHSPAERLAIPVEAHTRLAIRSVERWPATTFSFGIPYAAWPREESTAVPCCPCLRHGGVRTRVQCTRIAYKRRGSHDKARRERARGVCLAGRIPITRVSSNTPHTCCVTAVSYLSRATVVARRFIVFHISLPFPGAETRNDF